MISGAANLIPKRFQRKLEFRSYLQAWLCAALVVLVGCVVVGAQVRSQFTAREPIWNHLEQAELESQQLMQDAKRLRKQLASLRFVNNHLEALRPTSDVLQLWGTIVAAGNGSAESEFGTHVPNVRLQWVKINLREAKATQEHGSIHANVQSVSLRPNARNERSQLQIAVVGDEQHDIHKWMGLLEGSDRVYSVRLGNSGLDATTGGFQSQVHASALVARELP